MSTKGEITMTLAATSETLAQYPSVSIASELQAKDYTNLKLETLGYFKELQRLDFPIYFYLENRLFEVVSPGMPIAGQIDDLVSAKTNGESFSSICVKREDYSRYETLLNQIRQRKIQQLVEHQGRLNADVLHLFAELCKVSQMMDTVKLNKTSIKTIYDITNELALTCNSFPKGLQTICLMIKSDPTLYDHGASVGLMSGMFASKELGKNAKDTATLIRCGLFHDFGKNYISPAVLHKPGFLTATEFKLVKTHTIQGASELKKLSTEDNLLEAEVAIVAREHHEKFHGHGYPDGKSGRLEENQRGIHEFSRIVLLVDIFNALLMKQDYREAYNPMRALQIMAEDAERDYDPELWQKFKVFVEVSITEDEDDTPYVQRSGRFSISDIMKKRHGIKNAS